MATPSMALGRSKSHFRTSLPSRNTCTRRGRWPTGNTGLGWPKAWNSTRQRWGGLPPYRTKIGRLLPQGRARGQRRDGGFGLDAGKAIGSHWASGQNAKRLSRSPSELGVDRLHWDAVGAVGQVGDARSSSQGKGRLLNGLLDEGGD